MNQLTFLKGLFPKIRHKHSKKASAPMLILIASCQILAQEDPNSDQQQSTSTKICNQFLHEDKRKISIRINRDEFIKWSKKPDIDKLGFNFTRAQSIFFKNYLQQADEKDTLPFFLYYKLKEKHNCHEPLLIGIQNTINKFKEQFTKWLEVPVLYKLTFSPEKELFIQEYLKKKENEEDAWVFFTHAFSPLTPILKKINSKQIDSILQKIDEKEKNYLQYGTDEQPKKIETKNKNNQHKRKINGNKIKGNEQKKQKVILKKKITEIGELQQNCFLPSQEIPSDTPHINSSPQITSEFLTEEQHPQKISLVDPSGYPDIHVKKLEEEQIPKNEPLNRTEENDLTKTQKKWDALGQKEREKNAKYKKEKKEKSNIKNTNHKSKSIKTPFKQQMKPKTNHTLFKMFKGSPINWKELVDGWKDLRTIIDGVANEKPINKHGSCRKFHGGPIQEGKKAKTRSLKIDEPHGNKKEFGKKGNQPYY